MCKSLGAFLLALLLTCSVSAGIMPNDAPAPPPSQPATAVQEPTTFGDLQPGDVPSTDGDIQNGAAITFMQVVLNLLALS